MSHDVEPLINELMRQRWTLVCFGRRSHALAAVNRDALWVDVVVLRGHDRAAAYRTLTRSGDDPGDDPLRASWVVWHYLSDA
jgi:hypothetical protein